MKFQEINSKSLNKEFEGLPLGGILFKTEMTSTNDAALEWASKEVEDMSLVVTNYQTAGRGRKNRRWISSSGSSLTFSLILDGDQDLCNRTGLFSALGALAIVYALKEIDSRIDPMIKWPNDIVINKKKICGILTETVWIGEKIEKVIIGIGINVHKEAIPHPDLINYPASSLESELEYQVDRMILLRKIIAEILRLRDKIGLNWFVKAWEELLEYRGEIVEVWEDGFSPKTGKIIGLAQDGGLRLEEMNGNEILIHFGEMHLRPTGEVKN